MYQLTNLDREGAPTRIEAERDDQYDAAMRARRHRAELDALVPGDDPWGTPSPIDRTPLRTYPGEEWMDDPNVALNVGRFEADGFTPRNAVAPF